MKYCLFLLICFNSLMAEDYFPKNYSESREEFKSLVKELSVYVPNYHLDKYLVPSSVDNDLSVDYAYFPALEKKEKLILMVSGVHGPEAYAGSAIQQLFLKEYFSKLDHKRTGVILVHAMNPYGFKYHRRVSENNVNLNRNFDVSLDLFNTDNQGYVKLKNLLQPEGEVKASTMQSYKTATVLLSKIAFKTATVDELTEAVGRGQYVYENGIEFGGKNFEPQVLHFKDVLSSLIQGYDNMVAFDLHTGLGKEETLHVMTGRLFNEENKKYLNELLDSSEGIEVTDEDDDGFYRVYGDFVDFVQMLVPESTRFCGVTLEFGTVGNGIMAKLSSVNRMINENQGHHYGYSNKRQEKKVKKRFLKLFYPAKNSWKEQVIEKGRTVFDQVIKNL